MNLKWIFLYHAYNMKRLDFASTLRHIKHAQKKMTTKVKQKKQHRALEKRSGERIISNHSSTTESSGSVENPFCVQKDDQSVISLRFVFGGKMVITIIIAIVHQHATKDCQELLIFRLSILVEGFNVFSYYLSPSCQVNCSPALICKTKRPGHKSTTTQRVKKMKRGEKRTITQK